MEWIPLESSNLEAVRYLADTKVLEVRFRNGRAYQYQEVPENVYEGLLVAQSPGSYFSSNVLRKFETSRVDGPALAAKP